MNLFENYLYAMPSFRKKRTALNQGIARSARYYYKVLSKQERLNYLPEVESLKRLRNPDAIQQGDQDTLISLLSTIGSLTNLLGVSLGGRTEYEYIYTEKHLGFTQDDFLSENFVEISIKKYCSCCEKHKVLKHFPRLQDLKNLEYYEVVMMSKLLDELRAFAFLYKILMS